MKRDTATTSQRAFNSEAKHHNILSFNPNANRAIGRIASDKPSKPSPNLRISSRHSQSTPLLPFHPPPALPSHQVCFTPPSTAPLTFNQSILSSSSSSTSPTTTTLSPLIRYKPCGTSLDGSGSSGGRMMRSVVSFKTCRLPLACPSR
jgi:hypothetical protein